MIFQTYFPDENCQSGANITVGSTDADWHHWALPSKTVSQLLHPELSLWCLVVVVAISKMDENAVGNGYSKSDFNMLAHIIKLIHPKDKLLKVSFVKKEKEKKK